ncbi:unnamed protein product [Musa acuminata subsp. burmannicoides]
MAGLSATASTLSMAVPSSIFLVSCKKRPPEQTMPILPLFLLDVALPALLSLAYVLPSPSHMAEQSKAKQKLKQALNPCTGPSSVMSAHHPNSVDSLRRINGFASHPTTPDKAY